MSQPDVLILGGGVIGLSCAWRLAQAGLRVTVLEQRRCGHGASRAALGSLSPSRAANIGTLQRLHQASLWMYPRFVEELERVSNLATGYRRLPRYDIYDQEHQITAMRPDVEVANREWSDTVDGPVRELLDMAEVRGEFPGMNTVGVGALRCRASAVIHPAALIDALVHACRSVGVTIEESVSVDAISIEGKRAEAVSSNEKKWKAERVLIASGAWTQRLGDVVKTHAPVGPVKGQGVRVALAEAIPPTIFKRGALYLLPYQDDEWFVGATTEKNAGYDEDSSDAEVNMLLYMAADLFPALRNATVLERWAGLRPCSRDKKPVLGRAANVENLFFATGHFKIGIGLAPLTAALMCDEIMGNEHEYDLNEFAPGRWSKT